MNEIIFLHKQGTYLYTAVHYGHHNIGNSCIIISNIMPALQITAYCSAWLYG